MLSVYYALTPSLVEALSEINDYMGRHVAENLSQSESICVGRSHGEVRTERYSRLYIDTSMLEAIVGARGVDAP